MTNGEHWLQRRLKMFRPDIDAAGQALNLSNGPDAIGNKHVTGGLNAPS
jgi:hypothetical protein